MADLGGLGAKEGAPVSCHWTVPSILPSLLPWLAILLLLLVKTNHCAQAWWIWVPLGCAVVGGRLMPSAFAFFPAESFAMIIDLVCAAAFGVAAVWLLAPQLVRKHRFVTFLCVAPILAAFSLFSFMASQDWGGSGAALILGLSVPLAVDAVVLAVSILLAGLACRGAYCPLGLYAWLLVSQLVLWYVILVPLVVLTMIVSGGRLELLEFMLPPLFAAAVSFVTLLPFLVLSSASPFFRERFKTLLHVKPEVPPPLAASGPDVQLKT
jgi:hypothetical protein